MIRYPRLAALLALTLIAPVSLSTHASAASSRADKAAVVAPLDLSANRPLIMARINGMEPQPIMFDSGAQSATIPRSLAEAWKLEVIGEAMVGSPFGGTPTRTQIVSLGSLTIGTASATAVEAVVLDDAVLPPDARRVIIGSSTFADRVIELDPTAGTFKLSTRVPAQAKDWQKMDFRNMLVTNVTIGTESVAAHLDTGNPGLIDLPLTLAEKLKVAVAPLAGEQIRTVDTTLARQVGAVNQSAVVAGQPVELRRVTFAEIPSANIGIRALTGFRLIIDTPRKRWRLVRIAKGPTVLDRSDQVVGNTGRTDPETI